MDTPSHIAPPEHKVKIVAADLAIMDHVVHMENLPDEVRAKAESLGCVPQGNGKIILTREPFGQLDALMRPYITASCPGGSSANLMVMAKSLMKDHADMTFISAVGNDADGMAIREGLRKAGVALAPNPMPDHLPVEGAVSYVLVYPDGARITATYPGNAREMLKRYYLESHPDELETLIRGSSDVLMQGTQSLKIGPEITDRMEALRQKHDIPLIYTLPTNASYSHDHHDEIARQVRRASIVLGNDSELHHAFPLPETPLHLNGLPNGVPHHLDGVPHQYDAAHRHAVQQLQACFNEHQRENEAPGKTGKKPPVAFITRGADGCFIITGDRIRKFPGLTVKKVVNELGAGDGSAGTFIAMIKIGASLTLATIAAMKMGSELVQLKGARLGHDPFEHMKTRQHSPEVLREKGSSVAKVIHDKLHGESKLHGEKAKPPREPSLSR